MIDPNCTCEVAGTNDQWTIDVYGNYRCTSCDGILSEQAETEISQ